MWPSVICHNVYLLSTTGQFRLIQLHLRHGLSQWNNYKSADMLPGVVSNFLEGSKGVPYSWWTNILYHMWCTKDTCKSCEKPETTNFKLVRKISEASTPLKKSGRNSIPEIPLWTECGGCFVSRVEFPTTNNQTTEACPLLWTLNFCGWSSAQISWWFLGSASRNC